MVVHVTSGPNEVFASIRERRHSIEMEQEALRKRLDELGIELDELTVAQRVVARVTGFSSDYLMKPIVTEKAVLASETFLSSGTPTVPEMITTAVSELIAEDTPATGQAILSRVSSKWGAQDSNIVRPTIWRMWKAQRLIKRDGAYLLPTAGNQTEAEKIEAPRDTEAPPE